MVYSSLVKASLLTAGFMFTAAMAENGPGFHAGAHASISYNMVWGADEEIVLSETSTPVTPQTTQKTVTREYITGADKIAGIGFNIGGSALYMFNEDLGLRADLSIGYRSRSSELNYVVQTNKFIKDLLKDTWSATSDGGEDRTNLGEFSTSQITLDIPVMVRWNLPTGEPNTFFVEGGPMLTLNMSNSIDDFLGGSDAGETTVFSLAFGAGKPVDIGNATLDINVHFVVGMSSFINGKNLSASDLNFQVGAIYWFM